MDCIYERNPNCGFGKQHAGNFCAFSHNPPQPIIYHINLGFWCGNVCVHCKGRLERQGEVELLPPWKLPPWRRPPRPPLLRKPLTIGEDDED